MKVTPANFNPTVLVDLALQRAAEVVAEDGAPCVKAAVVEVLESILAFDTASALELLDERLDVLYTATNGKVTPWVPTIL
jgi:hypothetical protein